MMMLLLGLPPIDQLYKESFVRDYMGVCVIEYPLSYTLDGMGNCVEELPCWEEPLSNMEIADINSDKSSSRFGCVRVDYRYIYEGEEGIRNYDGIDLKLNIGETVFSIYSGTVWDVRHTDASSGYGNHIVIENDVGYFMYAHLQSGPEFEIGDTIEQGQFLVFSGESDTEDEPHLHIEFRKKTEIFIALIHYI